MLTPTSNKPANNVPQPAQNNALTFTHNDKAGLQTLLSTHHYIWNDQASFGVNIRQAIAAKHFPTDREIIFKDVTFSAALNQKMTLKLPPNVNLNNCLVAENVTLLFYQGTAKTYQAGAIAVAMGRDAKAIALVARSSAYGAADGARIAGLHKDAILILLHRGAILEDGHDNPRVVEIFDKAVINDLLDAAVNIDDHSKPKVAAEKQGDIPPPTIKFDWKASASQVVIPNKQANNIVEKPPISPEQAAALEQASRLALTNAGTTNNKIALETITVNSVKNRSSSEGSGFLRQMATDLKALHLYGNRLANSLAQKNNNLQKLAGQLKTIAANAKELSDSLIHDKSLTQWGDVNGKPKEVSDEDVKQIKTKWLTYRDLIQQKDSVLKEIAKVENPPAPTPWGSPSRKPSQFNLLASSNSSRKMSLLGSRSAALAGNPLTSSSAQNPQNASNEANLDTTLKSFDAAEDDADVRTTTGLEIKSTFNSNPGSLPTPNNFEGHSDADLDMIIGLLTLDDAIVDVVQSKQSMHTSTTTTTTTSTTTINTNT